MKDRVTVIEPSEEFEPYERVGIYCRVSSSSSAQLHSLASQASYLTRYVMSRRGWLLVDIYLDVCSGSSSEKRPEFTRLMGDVKRGQVSLVITKSISRFGRNAEDILTSTRMLKECGAFVYFEEQEIYSRSANSELYISTYAAVAESENEHISENTKWGIRKRAEDGTSAIYDRPCYGYRMGDDKSFVIVPEEAETVRNIYSWYLQGASVVKIKFRLEQSGVLSPSGKEIWSKHTIESILANKKYCGYSVIYKTYKEGHPKPKLKTNRGEHPMYEMADHHTPIIPLEVYERAQQIRTDRTNIELDANGNRRRKSSRYSAKIVE